MTKRFLVFALVAVMAPVALAQAASKPVAHKLSDKLTLRVLTSNASGAVFSGTIKDKASGLGAVIVNAKGGRDANTNTLTSTAFFKMGSISVKGSVTTAALADGSGFVYSGTARVVGGTGRFKGAKGTLKLAGSATSADPTFQTYTAKGTVTY